MEGVRQLDWRQAAGRGSSDGVSTAPHVGHPQVSPLAEAYQGVRLDVEELHGAPGHHSGLLPLGGGAGGGDGAGPAAAGDV
eukprot:4368527-Pyramimonas_sp.AAC.1